MVLITIGYIALAFVLVFMWSDKSGEIVVGFAVFASGAITKYFEHKKLIAETPSSPSPASQPQPPAQVKLGNIQ